MCPFHSCHSGRTSVYPKILFPKMLFCFGKIYFLLVILCITLGDKCSWYEIKRINKQCALFPFLVLSFIMVCCMAAVAYLSEAMMIVLFL